MKSLITAMGFLFLLSPAYAETGYHIFCDTPDQVVMIGKSSDKSETIQQINAEHPEACGGSLIGFHRGPTVKQVVNEKGDMFKVVEIFLVGGITEDNKEFILHEPMRQFMYVPVPGHGI